MDVTRKVINLARECGNKIELTAVDTGGGAAPAVSLPQYLPCRCHLAA